MNFALLQKSLLNLRLFSFHFRILNFFLIFFIQLL